jgi:hypothetical protein
VQQINDRIHFLDNEVVQLPISESGLSVAGYPYVSLTPFLQKDWEKWDDAEGEMLQKNYVLDGYTSENGEHTPISFIKRGIRSTVAEDLEQLAKQSNPRKTVYLIHEPPYNTPLDVISKDNKYMKNDSIHIGSKAVRRFIETQQPLLTLHGHIHETFRESGEFLWECKSTKSLTAAYDYRQSSLTYVHFLLPEVKDVERKIV